MPQAMVFPGIFKRQCASALQEWCSENTADARPQNFETRTSLFRELLGFQEDRIQQIRELKPGSMGAQK